MSRRSGGTDRTDEVQLATAQARDRFLRLQTIDEQEAREAIRIRDNDRRMEKIGRLLSQMDQELYRIIKNYPPYPPGDPERVKFLRSFNGLRQQIESLIIPPDEKWLGRMPGQAAIDQASTIAPPASPGIPIPALSDGADDAAVAIAAGLTDAVAAVVALRRRETAEATARNEEAAAVRSRELQQQDGGIVLRRFSEDEAGTQSAEARRGLTLTGERGMTMEQDLLLLATG